MRRRRPEKRKILPDPVYGDLIVAKFINNLMKGGKKSLAEKIFYASIDKIKDQVKADDGIEYFKKAIDNVSPILEVKSKRIGGATYQVPMEVRPRRAQALAMKWIIDSALKRSEKTMRERIASEIIDAHNNKGNAVKKREETHKMAESNRAFSHFRW